MLPSSLGRLPPATRYDRYEYTPLLETDQFEAEPVAEGSVRPQARRQRRNRMLQTALPCALLAGVLVTLFFVVGHVGLDARTAKRQRHTEIEAAPFFAKSYVP